MRPQDFKRPRTRPGFTLIELLIVMLIIGIILAFILSASFESLRRAQERQTQALISKIETALAERFDAVYASRATANQAHAYLGAIWSIDYLTYLQNPVNKPGGYSIPGDYPLQANSRAQIIARLDYLKAELPDVFIFQPNNDYPLNFAAQPYPGLDATVAGLPKPYTNPYGRYLLPLGIGVDNNTTTSFGDFNPVGTSPPDHTGIFGASYTARGAVMKGLIDAAVASGVAPPTPLNAGYDSVDNNGDGMVDDLGENGIPVAKQILLLLGKHTHKTARSETLYALLVEGQGPYGSLFNRDDFNDSEVKDTDGDGMMEFVDAWGEPLQFYRWPIGYVSDIADLVSAAQNGPSPFTSQQRGLVPYSNAFDTRDQNPLDPGQSLLDPAWWAGVAITPGAFANDKSPFGATQGELSGPASWFQSNFFALTDPNVTYFLANPPASINSPGPWDRGASTSTYYARRAYYSKYLVISGGPDKVPGVPVLDFQALTDLAALASLLDYPSFPVAGIPYYTSPTSLSVDALMIENQAAPATPVRYVTSTSPYLSFGSAATPLRFPPISDLVTQALIEASKDDISSHNILGPGGATQ